MKMIIVGDVVKFKTDVSEKAEEFVVRDTIVNNDEPPKALICSIKDLHFEVTEMYKLECTERGKVYCHVSRRFKDVFGFNEVGAMYLRNIKACDMAEHEFNYLATRMVDDKLVFTYIPFNKLPYFKDQDKYGAELRRKYAVEIKPIKLISRLLGDVAQFDVDRIMACLNKEIDANFELVSGSDITWYYDENMYVNDTGNLGSSCMRYSYLGEGGAFELYEDNAELLILKDNDGGKIYGRAIVWKITSNNKKYDGLKFMDRIYVTSDHLTGLFIKYAEDNNMMYLASQSYNTSIFIYEGDTVYGSDMADDIHVKLKYSADNYSAFPYIDTFKFHHSDEDGTIDESILRCVNEDREDWGDDYIYYSSTEGTRYDRYGYATDNYDTDLEGYDDEDY